MNIKYKTVIMLLSSLLITVSAYAKEEISSPSSILIQQNTIKNAEKQIFPIYIETENKSKTNIINKIKNPAQYYFVYATAILISKQGYFLTSAHAVKQQHGIFIKIKQKILPIKLIAFNSQIDIAVLKLDHLPIEILNDLEKIPQNNLIEFAQQDNHLYRQNLKKFSLNHFYPITQIAVFSLGHQIIEQYSTLELQQGRYVQRVFSEQYLAIPLLQTHIHLNTGFSGGALFDYQGKVIAMNTYRVENTDINQPQSLAIPIDIALYVAQKLIVNGKFDYLAAGLQLEDLDMKEKLFSPQTITSSVTQIKSIPAQSKLAQYGLQVGDIILAIQQQRIKHKYDVYHQLFFAEKRIEMTIYRQGKILNIQVINN